MILSSFAAHSLDLPITIKGSRNHVTTYTLTTTHANDMQTALPVNAHRVRLVLAPNTVVALRTN
jgi:hypothetical protein